MATNKRNPSTGLYTKNPTHEEIADNSRNQSDIVRAINNTGRKRVRVHYDYSQMDPGNPLPLAGITKVREMDTDTAKQFCKNVMRSRPNIFQIHIKLGDYPSKRRITDGKINMLNSTIPRFHTEVGEKIGEILADDRYKVVEIIYSIHNADPGTFNATAEVYGTTNEEYDDDNLFTPSIEFEFIKTT